MAFGARAGRDHVDTCRRGYRVEPAAELVVMVADEPLKRASRGGFPSLSSPDTMDHLQTHRPPPEAPHGLPEGSDSS